MCEGNEIAEIFRIKMNIFDFETPLCKEFKDFNHLLQIDIDVLTEDLPGFKTYDNYENTWYYEWNNEVSWVNEKPWLENGVWKEPTDDICDECKPFGFKSRHVEWPTCNWREDGYCNGGDLPGIIRVGNMVYFQDYEWYEGLEDGSLKEEALKKKLYWKDHGDMRIEKEKIFALKEKESSEDAWSNYLPNDKWEHRKDTTYIKSNVNSNYDAYNNVCQMFRNRAGINNDNDAIQANQEWFDEHEPMEDDDDDMGDLDD
ncbi:hypothetical protein Tco_1021875 [Tanacetum coccineum]